MHGLSIASGCLRPLRRTPALRLFVCPRLTPGEGIDDAQSMDSAEVLLVARDELASGFESRGGDDGIAELYLPDAAQAGSPLQNRLAHGLHNQLRKHGFE